MHTACNRQSEYNVNRTWKVYKADAESSSYSPLTQVNKENVHQLQLAWTFPMKDALENARFGSSECNPIIIDGVMYATSARHRAYAINASNGEKIWSFDPFDGGEGGGVNRGVTYWEKENDKRILFTAGDNLFAVDARTGKLISTFGKEGKVSMNVGLRDDPTTISVIPTSPGIVYQDLLILGAEVSELYGAQPGWIRAYNIITGKLEWTFHTIPLPGEPGYETWPKDAYKYAGGVNDWAGMSLDQNRGMVFLALGSPSYDFYGADRKGKNLYGNCVVALNAKTGKLIWYFQTVHHDLWDYDLPAPPNLVTVEKDGKTIDAVAQTTKSGFLFVFNRETGESLFPIEERKVPPSHIPGEEAWPTQPFPLKPKPYARQWMTKDDLSDFSPAAHDSLLKRFNSFRYEGLFTPPDTKGTLMLPGTRGGSSWGGGAFDPATGILYVKSNDSPEIDLLQKIEPEANAASQTVHSQGKTLYMNYCSSCHGKDRNGDEPVYPSLIGLKNRMTKESALNKIKQGGGKMPAFAGVIKGQEKAILAFLFEEQPKLSRKQAELLEIQRNKAAQKVTAEESPKTDTAAIYLNLTAYGYFRDSEGRPGIKPPWGTLHAINLNTGEYVWQIPVGNHPELQAKDAPETGSEGSAGPIVTAGGLVFIGGTRDKKLRAFDKDTGKKLWEIPLPAVANATACTYMSNNKQYIALSVAGDKDNPGGYIMAFALH
ncbi:outer membrane protein assembly factor BamB family protein [Rhodocytophaga rosea]|uniref:outer membrane protein assembly factor BamB family protein n=1 Tax=Rhodocytophaga rosea TaxID=2704465 RepID=UPI001E4F12F6|nr:PQQ-binding-like beta-propeller repeat protein [Rhodocytophaga rosea]